MLLEEKTHAEKRNKIRVDNKKECAYNNQSLAKADSHKRQVKNTATKVFKKTLKKVLTQKPGGGIINELSPRGGGCSLKIKQPSEINPVL